MVQRREEFDRVFNLLSAQPQPKRELAGLKRLKPHRGVDVLLENLFRGFARDLLDFHAAFGAGHHDQLTAGAVQDHAKVELARNVQPLLHQHLVYRLALGTRLVRHQVHADHLSCDGLGLLWILRQLHAAAFAAPARVDLGLDHHGAAQFIRDLARFRCRVCHLAPRHGHAETR